MVKISNGVLFYSGEKEYKYAVWSCKPFQIIISEIKYIALSPKLALDNEICFLVFVDINFKLFKLPIINIDDFTEIQTFFKLESFNKYYSAMFTYEDHYGKIDKIIFPKELFWENLFINNWKLFTRGLYSWIIPKSFFGNMIDYDN